MKSSHRFGRKVRPLLQENRSSLALRIEYLEDRSLLSATGFESDRFVAAASSGISGYTPAQIRHAYGFDNISFGSTPANGAGQTIAIVDAYDDPNIVADLHAFDAALGIADPPSFKVVGQTGSTTLPGTDPSKGWEGETALDVEWAHAIAPGANIVLVEAKTASDTDLFAAVNYARNLAGVSVISLSWGSDDSLANRTLDQSLAAKYLVTPSGHQGVTFVAATGDHGLTGFPATAPGVLAVGGTDLYLNSNSTIKNETAWVASGGWSGGGGASAEFSGRNTPDVSYNAGIGVAVYDTFGPDHGWVSVGGTSAGAPQWAALIAIANQGRALQGQSSLNGATQTLPAIYAASSADFHDITTGSTQTQTATVGYDLATGRGSPVANLLIKDLSGWTGSTGGGTTTVTAPLAPANFTAQALSSTQVALSWAASTGADGYNVYTLSGGQSVLLRTFAANVTSATISGLAAGSTTSYQVVAYNTAGTGASSWAQATTPAAAALAAPTNLKATATSTTVAQLTWTASAGASGYLVYSGAGSNAVQLGSVGAGVTTVSITGLTPGSSQTFFVEAYNAAGTISAASTSVSLVMPAAAAALVAPQNVTATETSPTTGTLSWTASAGATGYSIYWWNGSRAVSLGNVNSSTTSVTLQGLTAGSTNYFYIVAYNSTRSAASPWVALTTPVSSASNTAASLAASQFLFAAYGARKS